MNALHVCKNTNLLHPSIQDSHLVLRELHAHEPYGIAEQESQYEQKIKKQNKRQNKDYHELRSIIEAEQWVKDLCGVLGIPRKRGVASLFPEVTYQLSKKVQNGQEYVVIDFQWIAQKLDQCRSSVYEYVQGLERTELFDVRWIYIGRGKYPAKILFKPTSLLMTLINDPEKCWAGIEHIREAYTILRIKQAKLSTVPLKTEPSLLQHNMLEFSSSREKSVTEKNKNVTEIEEEKKAVAEPKPSSVTPEQPQDRIALKSNEAKGGIEPLSGTPTKSPEPQAQKTKPSFKKSWKEKKRAGKTKQRILRTPEIETILQEGWEYFKPIFQKEGEKPVLACEEEDFKTILSSRMTSHFSTFQHIKTYLDKISINQLLMGKRVMTNGKVWDLRLGFIFDDKIISASHNPYGQWPFISYNERDLSKKEEASVPKDMLEKLNFSQDQLTTVCEVVNEHLQHLEVKLVDKSAPKLTPEQIQKLIAARPVPVDPIPSESTEKAGERQGMEKHTPDEEMLLGNVFSPFDEAVKKHLLQMLPYSTYKAWIIGAKASFEEAEFGCKVTANGQFSKNQIETKFGQFIDWAQRSYVKEKEDKMSNGV